MTDASKQAIAKRNKENYLAAKAAFNAMDMAACMSEGKIAETWNLMDSLGLVPSGT